MAARLSGRSPPPSERRSNVPANMHRKYAATKRPRAGAAGRGATASATARTKVRKIRKATHGATVSAVARTKAGGKAVSAVARKRK